jgi:hypothetical protein
MRRGLPGQVNARRGSVAAATSAHGLLRQRSNWKVPVLPDGSESNVRTQTISSIHRPTLKVTVAEVTTAIACLNIDDPLVAWLVYRGEMVSAPGIEQQAMSFWTAGYFKALRSDSPEKQYAAEVALDELRRENFPNVVSRLHGFYLFADYDSAKMASEFWPAGFPEARMAEVGLAPNARWSLHDAHWITQHLGGSGRDLSWMDAYLGGHPSGPRPMWELVVDGRAFVFGTELREQAYEVVKATWPRSLGALELARLGVELGSDLALITALAVGDAKSVRVDYYMNFVDAEDPDFLTRLGEFDGPRRHSDLGPDFELVLPDLRPRGFTIELSP